jgi:hypothetical protein
VPSSSTANRCATARPADGIFSPQRLPLKLDSHGYSPKVLHKIVLAAGHSKSAALAAQLLGELAEFSISAQHVGELTTEVGSELAAKRDSQVSALPPASVRDQRPGDAPAAVAVEVDGGRIRTRAPGQGRGVHDPHWNEDKIACLVTLKGETFATDPHAELPECFLDRQRVHRLVQEVSRQRTGGPADSAEEVLVLPEWAGPAPDAAITSGGSNATAAAAVADVRPGAASAAASGAAAAVAAVAVGMVDAPAEAAADAAKALDWRPKRWVRTCVATMAESETFGKQVASEAYRRNFYKATRRAYVGDGQKYNWKIQERHFADFEGITDFVHVLTYVYAAALAVAGSVKDGWLLYVGWVRACWQGRVRAVIVELEGWQKRQETPPAQPPPTDPREVVRKAVTYLTNNETRMSYPDYRRAGLPCMSSWMESLVKEFNYRVKGSEKFWNRGKNAEAILQVRGAVLSEDDRLWQHIRSRPGSACRRYRRKKTEAE